MDDERLKVLVPCRVEEKAQWVKLVEIYSGIRLKGLSPEDKSFAFKMIHELTVKERVNKIIPSNNPSCWYGARNESHSCFL